jgi:hypothetical protein
VTLNGIGGARVECGEIPRAIVRERVAGAPSRGPESYEPGTAPAVLNSALAAASASCGGVGRA